jgi:hypothetical protein
MGTRMPARLATPGRCYFAGEVAPGINACADAASTVLVNRRAGGNKQNGVVYNAL